MIREREELLKQHYEVGKEIKKLKEKLSIYEEQFEVIGNRLCELEQDKDLLNRFQLHEEERKEGFQEIDAGKIPPVKPHVPNVPSKKRKISEIEDDEVTIEEVMVEIHGEETGAPDPPATTPAPIPTMMPTVAAALTTVATPTPHTCAHSRINSSSCTHSHSCSCTHNIHCFGIIGTNNIKWQI